MARRRSHTGMMSSGVLKVERVFMVGRGSRLRDGVRSRWSVYIALARTQGDLEVVA